MLSLSAMSDAVTPRTLACQAPLSMEVSVEEYWNRLPFPSPGDLPDPGIEPESLEPPTLEADSLPLSHLGRSKFPYMLKINTNVHVCVCVKTFVLFFFL